mmetsp:Transcript_40063/g.64992  ORF Transcript_40063/g.64992 Transcript_40063/m.64992 type:complete len:222 (-) Transcript_40063:788-1453(-)
MGWASDDMVARERERIESARVPTLLDAFGTSGTPCTSTRRFNRGNKIVVLGSDKNELTDWPLSTASASVNLIYAFSASARSLGRTWLPFIKFSWPMRAIINCRTSAGEMTALSVMGLFCNRSSTKDGNAFRASTELHSVMQFLLREIDCRDAKGVFDTSTEVLYVTSLSLLSLTIRRSRTGSCESFHTSTQSSNPFPSRFNILNVFNLIFSSEDPSDRMWL